MRSKSCVALVAFAAPALVGAVPQSTVPAGSAKTYLVSLAGHAEAKAAPGWTGDLDGSGMVRLTVDPAGKQICYDFTLSDLATPLMAHIHRGSAERNGPTVVTLFTGPGGDLDNCVMWTEKWLARIVADPSGFYVNLYTTEFPDGALRGQLMG